MIPKWFDKQPYRIDLSHASILQLLSSIHPWFVLQAYTLGHTSNMTSTMSTKMLTTTNKIIIIIINPPSHASTLVFLLLLLTSDLICHPLTHQPSNNPATQSLCRINTDRSILVHWINRNHFYEWTAAAPFHSYSHTHVLSLSHSLTLPTRLYDIMLLLDGAHPLPRTFHNRTIRTSSVLRKKLMFRRVNDVHACPHSVVLLLAVSPVLFPLVTLYTRGISLSCISILLLAPSIPPANPPTYVCFHPPLPWITSWNTTNNNNCSQGNVSDPSLPCILPPVYYSLHRLDTMYYTYSIAILLGTMYITRGCVDASLSSISRDIRGKRDWVAIAFEFG